MISRIALSLALCLCLAELSSAQRSGRRGGRRRGSRRRTGRPGKQHPWSAWGGLPHIRRGARDGTLLNQNYFICDWWFNFDCSTAEDLYSLNDEIAAEREALAADAGLAGYGAPAEYAAGSGDAPVYEGGAPVRRGRGRKLGGSRRSGRRPASKKRQKSRQARRQQGLDSSSSLSNGLIGQNGDEWCMKKRTNDETKEAKEVEK